MTIVHGQIESLKKVKLKLSQAGISRFESIGDINAFRKNFETEKRNEYNKVQELLDSEIRILDKSRIDSQNIFNEINKQISANFKKRIELVENNLKTLKSSDANNLFKKISVFFQLEFLKFKKANLERKFHKEIHKKTYKVAKILNDSTEKLNTYSRRREEIIMERCSVRYRELDRILKVVEDLNSLIAGAVDENRVVKELSKLSDENVLINDFSVQFDKPIYNKKEKDRIYSIQIDHLLITRSGIFIIETKNWSKKSIENYDLRSPVEQIRRTSHALFKVINVGYNQGIQLNNHHWGEKKIPIRNLVVMINHKPKEQFNFVQIKTLKELNRYINYFEPIFEQSEVIRIANFLNKINEYSQGSG
jgi:hypothetical protein